jgi:hypothetical protein
VDSSKIKALIIILVAGLAALYLGIAAATAQTTAIAWVVGALAVVFVLSLGKHVWILIPIMLPLQGVINAIPGAPSPWWAAMAIVGGIYALRFLMRRTETMQFRMTWLDFAILIQIIAVGQAYIRNPTGLLLMGGEMAGGKPYFIFGFAFVAYALLSVTLTDLRMIRWVVICAILVSIADSSLLVLSQIFPFIGAAAIPIYSNVVFATSMGNQAAFEAEVGRLEGGKEVGQNLGLALFSLFPPVTCINPVYIFRFTMTLLALAIILLSGFRAALGLMMIYFVVGCLIRRQYHQLIISGTAGLLGMVFLIASGLTTKLPYGAQRILSELSFVQVQDHIRLNAEHSTDFRTEMWVLALTTDRYIKNKFLGDGFGLSASEQRSMLEAVMGDQRAQSQSRGLDDFMARGSYHGFHVETIRFTGLIGLIAALISMGIFFKSALKLIRHFEGRPEWGSIIYICMPFLIYPFYYMLVFGSYRTAFPVVLASAGLLKMLDNIRVRELAAARAALPEAVSDSSPSHPRGLQRGRFPQPAMKTR